MTTRKPPSTGQPIKRTVGRPRKDTVYLPLPSAYDHVKASKARNRAKGLCCCGRPRAAPDRSLCIRCARRERNYKRVIRARQLAEQKVEDAIAAEVAKTAWRNPVDLAALSIPPADLEDDDYDDEDYDD